MEVLTGHNQPLGKIMRTLILHQVVKWYKLILRNLSDFGKRSKNIDTGIKINMNSLKQWQVKIHR